MLPVESIIDGTWGGSKPPPKEFFDFTLMKNMRWSWEDLSNTPSYVQRYCWDIIQRQLEHEHDEADKQRRANQQARGATS